jgi:hypothetical protein
MTVTIDLDELHCALVFDSHDPAEHGDLDRAVRDLASLRAARQALADWELVLTEFVADAVGRNTLTVDGVGTVEAKRGVSRKEWDIPSLLRVVLDSRMAPDPATGEADPTDDGHAEVKGEAVSTSPDLSRVLHVWNLGTPRVTALRDRGIDPDEFAATSPGRTSIVIN